MPTVAGLQGVNELGNKTCSDSKVGDCVGRRAKHGGDGNTVRERSNSDFVGGASQVALMRPPAIPGACQ